ncbi:unnamed protein product (mitochondrion) [Plasmodiophora brassicae]|uniref:UBC core domain-containing protein n=1 Tax=Plasmodiophora brassicae TaxID=37360 RepID=A0A3P3Y0R1_PLABS|nr:unnamed protein product [Plasmodiophora brassicae]
MAKDPKTLSRRILHEHLSLRVDPVPGFSIGSIGSSLRHLSVVMMGPEDSAYQGGTFHAEVFLPPEYPTCPPKVRILTRIYHPNIDHLGRVCLDALDDTVWTHECDLRAVLVSLQCLLHSAVLDDPIAADVAEHWRASPADAQRTARNWTRKYAMS